MSIDRRMDKENVVHIYNEILLSHKKECIESVLMRWMKLEPVIQSEVSQKEKNKYCILTHICGIRWYWWAYLQGRFFTLGHLGSFSALVSLIYPFCLHIWLTSATGANLKRTWWRRVLWAAKFYCDGTAGDDWSGLLDKQRATWGTVGSLQGEGMGNWE